MAPAVGVERRRVQAGPAGMVFGGQPVPAGTLGANEGTNGAGTLWWRTGAGRSRTSRRSGPARLEGTGLEGERAVGAAQGRSQETEAGGAVACGNDGDDQMDRGAAPHGHLDLSQSFTVLEAAGKRTMRCENTIILRTDPFTLPTAFRGHLIRSRPHSAQQMRANNSVKSSRALAGCAHPKGSPRWNDSDGRHVAPNEPPIRMPKPPDADGFRASVWSAGACSRFRQHLIVRKRRLAP